MIRTILGGATALALAATAFAADARADCWWNGYSWSCSYPTPTYSYYPGYWGNYGYGYQPYGYYSPYSGYPAYSYSYPGPRPSSGNSGY